MRDSFANRDTRRCKTIVYSVTEASVISKAHPT